VKDEDKGDLSTGEQLAPMFPMVVDRIADGTIRRGKTVNVWLCGASYPAMLELARWLQERDVPCHLDLDTAIGALGAAARYSAFREAAT
jgi:hypothetical protein